MYIPKWVGICFIGLSSILIGVSTASAHVMVKPEKVGVAAVQTFSVGVPNEKEVEVTTLRLVLPVGLKEVVPSAKAGWSITVKKNGEGDGAEVTEIIWSTGSIPVGQRDDFSFSAQVPSKEGALIWKAYQAYKDGSVVSWDQDPTTIKAGDEGTPFSKTQVVNDLNPTLPAPASPVDPIARTLGVMAFLVGLLALSRSTRRS